MKLSVKGLRLVRGGVSVAALPALDPCCVEVPRAPWGLMVLSVWREGGRGVPEQSWSKDFCVLGWGLPSYL